MNYTRLTPLWPCGGYGLCPSRPATGRAVHVEAVAGRATADDQQLTWGRCLPVMIKRRPRPLSVLSNSLQCDRNEYNFKLRNELT
jgi:hypothetical protein